MCATQGGVEKALVRDREFWLFEGDLSQLWDLSEQKIVKKSYSELCPKINRLVFEFFTVEGI